jgi:hypothetical protein
MGDGRREEANVRRVGRHGPTDPNLRMGDHDGRRAAADWLTATGETEDGSTATAIATVRSIAATVHSPWIATGTGR